MSQHPSLRSSDKDKQHRSVLKKYERLRVLKEKELWKEGTSLFGLPKVKVVRFKIKKEKAAKEAETALAPGAEAAPATPTAAPSKAAGPAKAAAPAKGAPAKEASKGEGKKESK